MAEPKSHAETYVSAAEYEARIAALERELAEIKKLLTQKLPATATTAADRLRTSLVQAGQSSLETLRIYRRP